MNMQSKKQLYIFALFFVLYELNCYLSNDMIMPAMVAVVNEFHAPLSDIALSLVLYIIGGSMLQIFFAPITDSIGKRKVMLGGNILFLVATITITLSNSINYFLVARFFQGMGMCFIFIGYAMIHQHFNDVNAVRICSILTNIAIFAPLLGPLIGTLIISYYHWKFIFVVSGILGVISLLGLYRTMPKEKINNSKIGLVEISRNYFAIFTNKVFMFGVFINGVAAIPIISWIGLSPTIIVGKMHASTLTYAIYQSIILGGFAISSICIQIVAGRLSFKTIIRVGSLFTAVGLICSSVLVDSGWWFILVMFLYAFGYGLCTGVIIRISLMSTGYSTSISAALMSVLTCIYISFGLELYNLICNKLNYTLNSYALLNIPIGIMFLIASFIFGQKSSHRSWA